MINDSDSHLLIATIAAIESLRYLIVAAFPSWGAASASRPPAMQCQDLFVGELR